MDTAPLRSFATWARPALIREVTARIAVVLAPASPQRVEQLKAVAALENAIAAAGGGDKGRSAVADRVAYTWFNRIIALRFMDANSYTGIGVVSPQAGVEQGQPEILAEAKRANIDPEVVSHKIRDTVNGLLNGSLRSDDPQGEAYSLLLAEYCRHWNRSMPFMFEQQGDFTELLMPANLLADASVLNRAVKVLTEEVCQDVEVIGWLYQFYISERKDEVFAGFKKNLKAGAAEIPAATQLFTPHWIVRYLLENSLGRLWMLNNPSSGLVDQMDYYIPPLDDEIDFLKVNSPEEIKLIDPASGSGHLLTYAFDLLYAIYEEQGYTPSDIPGLILTNNLYGTEIDPRAGALAAFALTMKARARQRTFFARGIAPSIVVLEPVEFTPAELDLITTRGGDHEAESNFWNLFADADIVGALIKPDAAIAKRLATYIENSVDATSDLITQEVVERAHKVLSYAMVLAPTYSVVAANPPYMGSKNMVSTLTDFAAREYGDAKTDLMTMFMERAQGLTLPGGYWAIIDLPSWMFLKTFESFRRWMLSHACIQSLLHLGRGVFGSDFGSVAFVCRNTTNQSDRAGVYRRLFTDHVDVRTNEQIRKLFLDRDYQRFDVRQSSFSKLPGNPIAYWLGDFSVFERPTIGESWSSAGRLKTHDGARYIRFWWEVDSGSSRWHPLIKGGEYRPYYGNREHVVDWSQQARSFYSEHGGMPPDKGRGKAGICWSKITSGKTSFRFKNPVEEFDSASPTILPERIDDLTATLGYLNSAPTLRILDALNPTINTQVGDVLALPDLTLIDAVRDALRPHGDELLALAKAEWSRRETAEEFDGTEVLGPDRGASLSGWHFSRLNRDEARRSAMDTSSREIDRIVEDAFARLSNGSEGASLRQPIGEPQRGPSELNSTLSTPHATVSDLVSFAVGCMFGRYSLDKPGLILANAGATVADYLAEVGTTPSFMPDVDNVIPLVDGDWFEDDIVGRFRKFLRIAFGEKLFTENLQFATEALAVKDLRDYFLRSFYADHVQRYKKRPIYWMFSSPKGSFNALIYMHRYTPSTVSTVLNEYLREFKAKLEATLRQQEQLAGGGGTPRQQAAAQKEADRIRKILLELDEYEHDVLYPLASQQIKIDLDDGVRVNYPKFGAALKKIPGLEAANE